MLLTKHADYAVRVLMYLARRPGEKVPITTIACAYDISRNHLMKVSQNLARHGYVIGYRGKGGGIALARPARNINLAEVIAKVEHNLEPVDCYRPPCPLNGDCNFHGALIEGRDAFLDALSRYTLAQLVSETPPLARVAAPPEAEEIS